MIEHEIFKNYNDSAKHYVPSILGYRLSGRSYLSKEKLFSDTGWNWTNVDKAFYTEGRLISHGGIRMNCRSHQTTRGAPNY